MARSGSQLRKKQQTEREQSRHASRHETINLLWDEGKMFTRSNRIHDMRALRLREVREDAPLNAPPTDEQCATNSWTGFKNTADERSSGRAQFAVGKAHQLSQSCSDSKPRHRDPTHALSHWINRLLLEGSGELFRKARMNSMRQSRLPFWLKPFWLKPFWLKTWFRICMI